MVYLFSLPCKIIFFHIRSYVIFWHSFLLKRRKKVCRQKFGIMGDAKMSKHLHIVFVHIFLVHKVLVVLRHQSNYISSGVSVV